MIHFTVRHTVLLLSCLSAALAASASAQESSAVSPKPVAAFAMGARILFQGDSITDGNRGRSMDPNHILGHGYAFLIAAKYGASFPERSYVFLNRGISGNTVVDLKARWQEDTLNLKPDILSILIGVNDPAGDAEQLDRYEQTYENLIVDTLRANSRCVLVLCEPFSLPLGSERSSGDHVSPSMRARQRIVAKLAQKHHAVFVQFQKVFDDACKRAPSAYWIWDSVHPTYSGHQLMADEWMRTVQAFLRHASRTN